MGQKMLSFVDRITVDDAKTFGIKLKSPTGLVLLALGKPSSNVPFMMPKRVAETDPNKQIADFIGLRPVRLQARRVEAGRQDRLRQIRQVQAALRAAVRPGGRQGRESRPRRMAADPRHQQAVNALLAGEIDLYRAPPHDLLPLIKDDTNIKLFDWNPLGQPVHVPLQSSCTSRSTTPRSVRRCSTRSTRRTS